MYIDPYEKMDLPETISLKTNFHTHAGTGENTCGAYDIASVFSLYKEAKYDVLTLSNHDLYTDVSKFQESHDLILFNGFEYSQKQHMLCINSKGLILGDHQSVINECNKQGGFVILCHPNWQKKEYWAWKDIDDLSGYAGIEIFNNVIFRLSGTGLATDTWDHLLSQGKLVWGFGNDDFHRWYDLAKTWNVILSDSRDHSNVQKSIQKGSFYVSTGLSLDSFRYDKGNLKISVSAKDSYVKIFKYVFIGANGEILDEQSTDAGEYHFSGDESYVRVQVISEHGAMLWTQPIYRKELFKKP